MKKLLSTIMITAAMAATAFGATIGVRADRTTGAIATPNNFMTGNILESVDVYAVDTGDGRIHLLLHGGAITNRTQLVTPQAADRLLIWEDGGTNLYYVRWDQLPSGGSSSAGGNEVIQLSDGAGGFTAATGMVYVVSQNTLNFNDGTTEWETSGITNRVTANSIGMANSAILNFIMNGSPVWTLETDGDLHPFGDILRDFGSTAEQIKNAYASAWHGSNFVAWERAGDPANVANQAMLYGKEDGGVTKLYAMWDDGTVVGPLGTGAGSSPGGNSGAIQFNQGGLFDGTNTFRMDRTNEIFYFISSSANNLPGIAVVNTTFADTNFVTHHGMAAYGTVLTLGGSLTRPIPDNGFADWQVFVGTDGVSGLTGIFPSGDSTMYAGADPKRFLAVFSDTNDTAILKVSTNVTLAAGSTITRPPKNATTGVLNIADGSYQYMKLGANTNFTVNLGTSTNQTLTLTILQGSSDHTVTFMGNSIPMPSGEGNGIDMNFYQTVNGGATNFSFTVINTAGLGLTVTEGVSGTGAIPLTNAPIISVPKFLTHIEHGSSASSVYTRTAPTNNVTITNFQGLIHLANASPLSIDANQGHKWNVTNRITADRTLVFTNTADGQEISVIVLGEASGGSSRTITLVPHLGHLIARLDDYSLPLTNQYGITLTNGNAIEINWAVNRLNGTNVAGLVTRQFKF